MGKLGNQVIQYKLKNPKSDFRIIGNTVCLKRGVEPIKGPAVAIWRCSHDIDKFFKGHRHSLYGTRKHANKCIWEFAKEKVVEFPTVRKYGVYYYCLKSNSFKVRYKKVAIKLNYKAPDKLTNQYKGKVRENKKGALNRIKQGLNEESGWRPQCSIEWWCMEPIEFNALPY